MFKQYGSLCLVYGLEISLALGFAGVSQAQNSLDTIPGPMAKQCGAPILGSVRVADPNALTIVKQAVLAMDPGGAYEKVHMFSLAGSLSDWDNQSSRSTNIGNFQIQEDHSVSGGAFERKFLVKGIQHTVTRSAGRVSDSTSDGSGYDLNKLAFIPKSYMFPLALLKDDLQNSHISAFTVTISNPGTLQGEDLRTLLHIELIDSTSSESARYGIEDWYFDSATHLPLLVAHQLPTLDKPSHCVEVYTHFGDFQTFSGTTIPTTISTRQKGDSTRIATIQTVKY